MRLMPISDDYKLAYSTDSGGTCEICKRKLGKCRCSKAPRNNLHDASAVHTIIHISLERRKRKGKSVMILTNIPYDKSQLKQLCSCLKQLCSSGGTVKGDTIEIQGENAQAIKEELDRRGLRYKITNEKLANSKNY